MSHKTREELIAEAKEQIEEVSPEDAKAMFSGGEKVVYLDVREMNEWNFGRIPRAVHLPLGNLETKIEGLIDRQQRVVVYCARAIAPPWPLSHAAEGTKKVASMARGFGGWVE